MHPDTLLRGVRVIDPHQLTDRLADVLIADGRVAKIAEPGSWRGWVDAQTSDAPAPNVICGSDFEGDVLLTPGLVDIHTHTFGAAGVDHPDRLGTGVAVPTIVDAGGAGAASIDDFVSLRSEPAATRLHALMSIEAGGITDDHPSHNTTRPTPEMVTTSIDTFIGAVERHEGTVLGLKLWASKVAGERWLDFGVSLGEISELPIMVHIGDYDSSGSDSFTVNALDRLQGGDIVTHCFTGLDGAVVQPSGEIDNAALAARQRGVLFDVAPGLVNLSFERATMAMEQGFLPDTISSDAHRWMLDQRLVAGLPQVMSSFLALGLSLHKTIECATVNAADAVGVRTGRPVEGSEATLSVLQLRRDASIYSDGTESIRGSERLVPVGCFVDGTWFVAGELKPVPSYADHTCTHVSQFIEAVIEELDHHHSHDARWRGTELHQLVHRARRDYGLSIPVATDALFHRLAEKKSSLAAGWLLERLGPHECLSRLTSLTPVSH